MERRMHLSRIAGLLVVLTLATPGAGWTQTSASASSSPVASSALGTDGFFTTTDGVRLHYRSKGTGRAIVFVPGWTLPGDIWEPQIRHFSPRYRTIALDPRSQG